MHTLLIYKKMNLQESHNLVFRWTWSVRPWFPQVVFVSEDQTQSVAAQLSVHSEMTSASAVDLCVHSASAVYGPTSESPSH